MRTGRSIVGAVGVFTRFAHVSPVLAPVSGLLIRIAEERRARRGETLGRERRGRSQPSAWLQCSRTEQFTQRCTIE